MKNAIIFHGTSCSPNMFWYPYVKGELEKKGYQVWVPHLPQPDKPDLSIWLPYALKNGKFTKDTVIIGHSAGTALTLGLLENIKTTVKQVILVAGFCSNITGSDGKILKDSYDWKKINSSSRDFIFINSDDDPWGINDESGRELFNHLGGTQIILHGQGHMGSNKLKQAYKEFPLLVKLIA